jgi:hypothetical protein
VALSIKVEHHKRFVNTADVCVKEEIANGNIIFYFWLISNQYTCQLNALSSDFARNERS